MVLVILIAAAAFIGITYGIVKKNKSSVLTSICVDYPCNFVNTIFLPIFKKSLLKIR